ncbi:hypothetical protein HY411_00225 [Candidatus Gottesmanbacteria bacterium]|nr:hypothetical protein [Candidatus Gottesmanbacteria bacterium]
MRYEMLLASALAVTACTRSADITPDVGFTLFADRWRAAFIVEMNNRARQQTIYTRYEVIPVMFSVTRVERMNGLGPNLTSSSRLAFGVTTDYDGTLKGFLPIP